MVDYHHCAAYNDHTINVELGYLEHGSGLAGRKELHGSVKLQLKYHADGYHHDYPYYDFYDLLHLFGQGICQQVYGYVTAFAESDACTRENRPDQKQHLYLLCPAKGFAYNIPHDHSRHCQRDESRQAQCKESKLDAVYGFPNFT